MNNYQNHPQAVPSHLPRGANYFLYGHEVASTGTPHLQCYIQFHNLMKKCSVILLLSNRIKAYEDYFNQVDKCKGSDLDNYKYCTKEGDFIEFGERVAIGRKEIPKAYVPLEDRELELLELFHNYLTTIGEGHTTPSYSYEYYQSLIEDGFKLHIYYPAHQMDRALESYIHYYYSKYPKGEAPLPQFEYCEIKEKNYLVNG